MDIKRRDFLKIIAGLGATSLVPVLTTGSCGDPKSLEEKFTAGDKNVWSKVRSLFTFTHQAPLNAANLCPAFDRVIAKQEQYARRLSSDVGFPNRRDFVLEEVENARKKVCEMLNAGSSKQLAFVRNTSEANTTIIQGLQLKPDDEVVLWDENHPTNYHSWHYQRQVRPFIIKSLGLDLNAGSTGYYVDSFIKLLTPKTRVVSFSHISNISGHRLPAEKICAAVKKFNPDIFVLVDGAQAWGSVYIDLKAMGCDGYTSSGHKWLCGPRGTGILYVREKWIPRVMPNTLGYNFTFDYPEENFAKDATRFECLGQRDDAAYGALGISADLHREIGIRKIEKRISELTAYGLNAFDRAGIPTITPKDQNFGHGVLTADMGSTVRTYGAFLALHNAGISSAFIHNNRVHCTPESIRKIDKLPVYLRICPHIYNSTGDIDQAVSIAKRIKTSALEIGKEVVRFI
ncbi:MAG TPA: aminotransferase class V-fold PLP-dependent enzyme [Spirochaetes bacterium]|nr:aminotransferase class V-fold PLP-dependent enzyme [Spirochaetota bacterium]